MDQPNLYTTEGKLDSSFSSGEWEISDLLIPAEELKIFGKFNLKKIKQRR